MHTYTPYIVYTLYIYIYEVRVNILCNFQKNEGKNGSFVF